MAVVGFDVGTYSCFIGVARAGGIETIANEASERSTPTYVSLAEKSRFIGNASKQQQVTNYKNTVNGGFKRLLGRSLNDPFVQLEKNRFFRANDLTADKDGNVIFQLSYLGEKQTFTPRQMMAMMLSKLKQTAEIALKTKVVDAVISVPVYFTDCERRALLDAAAGAGLNCLRLINDTTAAALGYGITKQDLPADNEKPRIVVFADLGYSSLQVSACAFNKGKLKVLATSCDQNVGGRDFDDLLAHHFSEEFRTKYKVDAESKPKPYIRLLQECEKLKKLMSANIQAIPLSIECFMDDKDVSGRMSREEFEKLSAPLFQRIDNCLQNVLANAKLKPTDVHSVEILGGSSRIPAFKKLVTDVFSKEPSTTLNADEAVARGCALQCAILSPTFRVRDFSIADCLLYPITLTWEPQNQLDEGRIDAFPQFHQYPSSKILTYHRKEPFVLNAVYTNPANVPIPNPQIGQWKVNNVIPQPTGESSKVKVKVRINGSGIFSVSGATLFEKVEGASEEKEESMDVDDKDEAGTPVSNGTPDETPMQTDGGEKPAEGANVDSSAASNQDNAQNGDQDNKDGEKDKAAEDKKATKKKNKVKTIELPVEGMVPQLSRELLNLLIEKEGQMIMQDRLEKDKADAKNAVEEYIYEMRDKLGGSHEVYMQEDDRNSFLLKLEDVGNWLYEEGEDMGKQVYMDKLADLKKIGQPVIDRFNEAENWPAAMEKFNHALVHVRKFLNQYAAGDEKYAHIDKSDVDKVQKCLDEKAAWWTPKMDAQNKIQKHENPILLKSQVDAEIKAMEYVCNPIINKPKPKVEPPKEEEKKEDGSANNSGAGGDPTPADPAAEAAAAPSAKTGDMEVD